MTDVSWERVGEFKLSSLKTDNGEFTLTSTLTINLYCSKDSNGSIEFKSSIEDLELWVTADTLAFSIRLICDLIFKVRDTILLKSVLELTDLDRKYLTLFI